MNCVPRPRRPLLATRSLALARSQQARELHDRRSSSSTPGRLWWLLLVAALGVAYVVVQRWRRRATVRFTQVELLDRVAPSRPGWRRHVVAALQLLGLAIGVVAIARPITTTTERTESEGRILVLFDVSLSMMATDVEPDRLEAAKEAARAFVDQVDADIEVGLISFSGNVAVEVPPTLDRESLDEGIDNLELAESTAIGDALATGADLLTRLADDGDEDDDAADTDTEPRTMSHPVPWSCCPTVRRPSGARRSRAPKRRPTPGSLCSRSPSARRRVRSPSRSAARWSGSCRPEPLAEVAEVTGGAAYEAATSAELGDAYERIRDSLGDTLGEEIEIVTELTWRWAAAALAILTVTWVLALWWLRGLISAPIRVFACIRVSGVRTPHVQHSDRTQPMSVRRVSMVLTGSGPTGVTLRWVTPASS